MADYKIWCKEPESDKAGSFINIGSRQDLHQVAGRLIDIDQPGCLAGISNADTLRIFAHGSIDKVGGMTARTLADMLYQKGLRQANLVELVACDTAINTRFKKSFAARLLEHMSRGSHKIAVGNTKGAMGTLTPYPDGDAVEVGKETLIGDAGKKTYGTQAGCMRLRAVSVSLV